jgi:hypothetical protein
MRERSTVALCLVFCCGYLAAQESSFTIRSADTPRRLEVRYFLTGPFGGYGGFVQNSDRDGSYRIPLSVDPQRERVGTTGVPAQSLKAILYAPGCQFQLLSVDLKTTSNRAADFECRPLSTVRLSGTISWPHADTRQSEVEILYVADWDHRFFGIGDGMVQQFRVGTARFNSGSRFQVEIPDFSKDAVTTEKQAAYLQVRVIAHPGENQVERVVPPAALQYNGLGLKILSRYDSEISFSAR